MPEHSPEPWRARHIDKYHLLKRGGKAQAVHTITAESTDGYIVAIVPEFLLTHEANARRIVACVNACKGYATKDLEEVGSVRELVAQQDWEDE